MRAPRPTHALAVALVALAVLAGCGDANDANVFLGDEPTPTPGGPTVTAARTATPVSGRTATPATTATPTPATSSSGAKTATPTASAGGPTATPTPSGAVDADVQTVVSDILPFLTTGPNLLSGGGFSALTIDSTASSDTIGSVEAVKNDPCPDGGTRVDDQGLPVRTITLTGCKVSDAQLGAFQFDGMITITISLSGGTIAFDFAAIDLNHNNHTVHFSGSLSGLPQSGGFVLNGPVTVMTPEGNFTLNLNAITIDSNHKLVSGSGTANDDNDNFDIATISMTVAQGGATANFSVTFDDTSVHTYTLNLTSGQLTQTS